MLLLWEFSKLGGIDHAQDTDTGFYPDEISIWFGKHNYKDIIRNRFMCRYE